MPEIVQQQTVSDLGKLVKAKYPGDYDDLGDDELGRLFKKKYPGDYDDFPDVTTAKPQKGADPNDFTAKYNTPIPAQRQAEFEKWRSALPKPLQNSYDYDLQGAFLNGSSPDYRAHMTDRFKKPNHSTFSDGSMYHGKDGYTGGHWGEQNGQDTYQPSDTNLKFRSPEQLQQYFKSEEPKARLLLPQSGAAPAQRAFVGPPTSAKSPAIAAPQPARPSPFPNVQAPMGLPQTLNPQADIAQMDQHANTVASLVVPTHAAAPPQTRAGLQAQFEANPPGVPAAPLPAGLGPEPPPPWGNMSPFEAGLRAVAGLDPTGLVAGPVQAGYGVRDIAKAKNLRQAATGATETLGGALEAASPAIAGSAMRDLPGTLKSLGVGTAIDKGVSWTLKKLGVPEEYADLAGAVSGLAGGGATHAKGKGKRAAAPAEEPTNTTGQRPGETPPEAPPTQTGAAPAQPTPPMWPQRTLAAEPRMLEARKRAEAAAKKGKKGRPVVPSEGPTEQEQRVAYARRNLAQQFFKKEWADLDSRQTQAIDGLIREGYGGARPDRASFAGEKQEAEPSKPAAQPQKPAPEPPKTTPSPGPKAPEAAPPKKETEEHGKQTQIRTDAAAGERGKHGEREPADTGRKPDVVAQPGGERAPAVGAETPAAPERPVSPAAPVAATTAVEAEAPEKPPQTREAFVRRVKELREGGMKAPQAGKQAAAEGYNAGPYGPDPKAARSDEIQRQLKVLAAGLEKRREAGDAKGAESIANMMRRLKEEWRQLKPEPAGKGGTIREQTFQFWTDYLDPVIQAEPGANPEAVEKLRQATPAVRELLKTPGIKNNEKTNILGTLDRVDKELKRHGLEPEAHGQKAETKTPATETEAEPTKAEGESGKQEYINYGQPGGDHISGHIHQRDGEWRSGVTWGFKGYKGSGLVNEIGHPTRASAVNAMVDKVATQIRDQTAEGATKARAQKMLGWLEGLREKPPAAPSPEPAQTPAAPAQPEAAKGETPYWRVLMDNAKRLQTEAAGETGKRRTRLLDEAADLLDEAEKRKKLADADAALAAAKAKTAPKAEAQETGPHGPVLRNFRHDAAGAIAELRRRKSGDAIGALHHPEIGDIDLVWGKTGDPAKDFKGGYGLAHIDAKHPGIADQLADIIPTLRKDKIEGGNRQLLVGKDHRAVVGLDWSDEAKRWLLTAYEEKQPGPEELSGGSERAGVEGPATPSPGVSPASSVAPGYPPKPGTPAEAAGEVDLFGNPVQSEDAENAGAGPGLHPGSKEPAISESRGAGQKAAYGDETDVYTEGRERPYKARYVLREVDDVQPSHNPFTFDPNPKFEHVNDRDYKLPANQNRVLSNSGPRFNPVRVINDNPDAINGPTVIDRRLNALGGNNRDMTLKRVYELNPKGAAAYRARLAKKLSSYGIDPAALPDFKKPGLYRELAEEELNTPEFSPQKAITDFNLDPAAELATGEAAAADARNLKPEGGRYIAQAMDQMPPDATLTDMLNSARGPGVINFLIQHGPFTENERPTLLDATKGTVTAEAKQRIAKMLLGGLFKDSRAFQAAEPSLRNKLERAAATLKVLEGKGPEWDLTPDVKQAIEALEFEREYGKAWGLRPGETFEIKNRASEARGQREYQATLGGEPPPEPPELSERARAIGEFIRTSSQTAIAKAFRSFAEKSGEFGLFQQSDPDEAFAEAFGPKPSADGMLGGGATSEFMGFQTLASGIARAAKTFGEKDVVPSLKNAAAGVRDFVGDALTMLAPTLRTKSGQRGSLIFRARLAELARESDQARHALRDAIRYFDKQKASDNFDFIDRMEAGRPQKTAALDDIADTLRKLLDERRDAVRALGKGKLQKFYTNYFPHIWKDKRRAESIFAAFFGKRPLEGGKSFLKQRTLPTFADGINRGLEPLSDNPVDLVLAKLYEMGRFTMAHKTLADWKAAGLARFVDARKGKAPKGWKKIDESIGTVYGPSVQNIAEYPNEGLYEALKNVVNALGLTHNRGFKNLRGAIGRAHQGGGLIETAHGSKMGTLAHEIGHQIDWLAGSGKRFVLEYPDPQTVARLKRAYATLKDPNSAKADRTAARLELKSLRGAIAQRKQFAQELRDLADLRTGGSQSYRRSREEKMAQLAQMWAEGRPLFERTAPTVFREWKKFLDENPKLHALRDIEASANPTTLAQPYDVGGLVVRGHYYAPEGAALIMNNYLSPGLRRFAAYRGMAALNNTLNQAQLGLSGFHLGFVSADAAVSKAALGFQALLRGRPFKAARYFAETPVSPLTTYLRGRKGIAEWRSPGSQGAAMKALIDHLERAGARISMDQAYRTDFARTMRAALRQGNVLGAAVRAPLATLEGLSNVLMGHIVPAMKMGAAMDLMRFHLGEMDPNTPAEDVMRMLAQDWNSIDNRLGEMVYDNLFWNRTAKDLAMISVRSVGWNLGTLREIGGGIGDLAAQPMNALKGKPVNLNRLSYLMGLVTTTAVMNAVYQYLHTGKPPDQAEDYFFPKNGSTDEQGRPQRSSPPTYIKDVYHYATHPLKTLANKAAPIWSAVDEMIRNKDFYGNKIRNADDPLVSQLADVAKHAAKTAIPIGVRNYQRETALGSSPEIRAEQFVGMSPAPAELDKTPAERLAAELAAERTGDEPGRPADAAERRDLRLGLSRALRAGKAIPAETLDAIRAGKLTTRDLKLAYTNAHESPLEGAFSRLTIGDALKVYRAATADERLKLRGMLLKKGQNALRSEPPAARVKTLQGLREAFAVH